MLFDLHVLENYIQHKQIPDEKEWFYTYTNGYRICENHRQEVVRALADILIDSILQFPFFNKTCIDVIFKDELPLLNNVIIMPILASAPTFDSELIEYNGSHYLLIDLLNIADYSTLLNEMQYILQNQIVLHLVKFMIHARHKKQEGYLPTLQDIFFCDGLAQYLAWNEDCAIYPFQESNYQKRKHSASALLHKFYFTEDVSLQIKVEKLLKDVEFWNCFPMVYGMLYFHDIYLENKEKGLYERFALGPSQLKDILLQN